MRIFLHASVHFEKWSHRSPDTTGIGGSETSQIMMAQGLARRGHKVTSYCPLLGDPCVDEHGVEWKDYESADLSEPGLWIVYRSPKWCGMFADPHPKQTVWLVCQDVDYASEHNRFTEDNVARCDRILPLCLAHEAHLIRKYPFMKDKTFVSSNGVRMDLVRQVAKEGIGRDPKKIVFASSPDRGLPNLLKIFRRCREYVPDLKLEVCYGWGNIDKIVEENPKVWLGKVKRECLKEMADLGVFHHERLAQVDVYRQWFSAGLMVYPTNFTETNCCVIQESQACGTIPIASPVWALREKMVVGVRIEGDPDDALTRARFVDAIYRVASNPSQQDAMRKAMQWGARTMYNYERTVDQWERWMLGGADEWVGHYLFQHKHASGRILNVGCDDDYSGFKSRGAVNLDACGVSPITKHPTKADVIHDARVPLPFGREFQTVVLGDILEHMSVGDGVKAIANARDVLAGGGKVVITIPDDDGTRELLEREHIGTDGTEEYAPGVLAHHSRKVPKEAIVGQIEAAGMKVETIQEIDYTFAKGWGIVARKKA